MFSESELILSDMENLLAQTFNGESTIVQQIEAIDSLIEMAKILRIELASETAKVGLNYSEMARQLGVSRQAISSRYRRKGIHQRPRKIQ